MKNVFHYIQSGDSFLKKKKKGPRYKFKKKIREERNNISVYKNKNQQFS